MREADQKERRVEDDSSGVGKRRLGASETVLMKGPGSRTLPGPRLLEQTLPKPAWMTVLLLPHLEVLLTVLKYKSDHTLFPRYCTYFKHPSLTLPWF